MHQLPSSPAVLGGARQTGRRRAHAINTPSVSEKSLSAEWVITIMTDQAGGEEIKVVSTSRIHHSVLCIFIWIASFAWGNVLVAALFAVLLLQCRVSRPWRFSRKHFKPLTLIYDCHFCKDVRDAHTENELRQIKSVVDLEDPVLSTRRKWVQRLWGDLKVACCCSCKALEK